MRIFAFLICLVYRIESSARFQEWDKWSEIERHGNQDVKYTERKLAGWRVFVDQRLTEERGDEAANVLRKDLFKTARKLPKAARGVLRKNVDIFMSKDFFYDEATSKIFNRTHVEMRNLFFLFKKWPRENQPGGEFISDMIVEIYNYRDFVNGTLNHTEALFGIKLV